MLIRLERYQRKYIYIYIYYNNPLCSFFFQHVSNFFCFFIYISSYYSAVAKGAQQAGVFVVSHIVYCSIDKNECMFYNHGDSLWNKMQKSIAAILCVAGVVIYAMSNKSRWRGGEIICILCDLC